MPAEGKTITIFLPDNVPITASSFLAAPGESSQKQDLIRMGSLDEGPQGKFTLHTLAQQALFDFEDHELSVQWLPAGAIMRTVFGGQEISITQGVIVALEENNHITLLAHQGINVAMLLRAIHRCATHMIRLDVR